MKLPLTFPVTEAVLGALGRLPRLAASLRIREGERRSEYIVALLDNTHYRHNEVALRFIEGALPWAGAIGTTLLEAPVQHQFLRAHAELLLLGHLRESFGDRARPAERTGAPVPDIFVDDPQKNAAVEVYSPTDSVSAEILNSYLLPAFRYADVPRGFKVHLDLKTTRQDVESVFYLLQLPPGESTLLAWMVRLIDEVREWLSASNPPDRGEFREPSGVLTLIAELLEVSEDAQCRSVSMGGPTKSTDSRILFECAPEVVAETPWGRKLSDKLRKHQAGTDPGERLRILVVNFDLMDTGEPQFIAWTGYAESVRDAFALVARGCGEPPPYDVVLPSVLRVTPVFGMAALVALAQGERGPAFLRASRMEHTPVQRPW